MTIRELEIFIEVVKTKSMSEAAKKLNVSQPTVSHAISEIENEYNVVLFKRVSKKLYITATGNKLYNYSLRILDLFKSIDNFLKNSTDTHAITIVVSLFADTFFLTNTIKNFEYVHPEINITVTFDTIENIIDKVQFGIYDIGIICEEVKNDNITSKKLFDDELVLVCSRKHPLSKKESISIKDLANEDFALRKANSAAKRTFLNHIEKNKVPINLKWICSNNDTVLNIIESNSAISVLSKYSIHDDTLVSIPFNDINIHHSYNIIYSSNKKLNRELTFLKNYIVDITNR